MSPEHNFEVSFIAGKYEGLQVPIFISLRLHLFTNMRCKYELQMSILSHIHYSISMLCKSSLKLAIARKSCCVFFCGGQC